MATGCTTIEEVGDIFSGVLRLLCAGQVGRVGEGKVGWRFSNPHTVTKTVVVLFEHMNELHERFGLPDSGS